MSYGFGNGCTDTLPPASWTARTMPRHVSSDMDSGSMAGMVVSSSGVGPQSTSRSTTSYKPWSAASSRTLPDASPLRLGLMMAALHCCVVGSRHAIAALGTGMTVPETSPTAGTQSIGVLSLRNGPVTTPRSPREYESSSSVAGTPAYVGCGTACSACHSSMHSMTADTLASIRDCPLPCDTHNVHDVGRAAITTGMFKVSNPVTSETRVTS